jgi:hypothetical protein
MKKVYRDIVVLIVFTILSMLIKFNIDDFFMNTIFTVLSIMFSIGLGILVTFNLHGARKKSFISKIRRNINLVRDSYIYYFSISTLLYIIEKYVRKSKNNLIDLFSNDNIDIQIDFSFVVCFFLLYAIFYFIFNFLQVQKLNEEIFDNTI